jgi:hypothetical protein
MPLNSRTSAVDGSSEGGRINTELLANTLALYGTALVDELKARGYTGKVTVRGDLRDGIPVLVAVFADDPPKFAPKLWHGRRVIVEKDAPPPKPS